MRVQPRPDHRAKATVGFEEFGDGVEAARRIAQARLYPANCRLLDRNEATLNRVAATNVLVLGFESTDSPVEGDLDRAVKIAEGCGGELRDRSVGGDDGTDTEGDWRDSFFEAPYRFNGLVSVGVLAETFETSVTWEGFGDLHDAVRREVVGTAEDVCGDGFLSCRFTHVYEDGPAPYYTVLAPVEPGEELGAWRAIKTAASDVLDEHGAATTHHHAVGRVHKDWYRRETSAGVRDALRSAKDALDPECIMNPGVLLGSEGGV